MSGVELVRTIYERFRAGEEQEALALFDTEIVVQDRPEVPDPQVYHGREGVLRSLNTSRAAFDGLDLLPEEFLDLGERVIVVFRFQGKGRGSGVPIDERLCHVWTVRDGKAVRMEVHSDLDAALRAADVAWRPSRSMG